MLRKIVLALVAAASLSAMALAPTAAHHHFGPGFGIGYFGGGYGGGGCFVTRRVPTPFGFRWRTVNVCGY